MVRNGFIKSPRWTPLIWILWFFDSCDLCCHPTLRHRLLPAAHYMSFFEFLVWLLVCFHGLVLFSYLIGFSSQLLIRIKIGANMAAAAGLTLAKTRWQHSRLCFWVIFWLILNMCEPSPRIFCVFFRSWFLLFVNESKIEISFVANWYKIYELKILPKWYQRVRIVHILDLINWKKIVDFVFERLILICRFKLNINVLFCLFYERYWQYNKFGLFSMISKLRFRHPLISAKTHT